MPSVEPRIVRLSIAAACALTLAACVTRPPPLPTPPPDTPIVPDAVPKTEPRASRGNPQFYEVLGKRYFVLPTAQGYLERGIASWYGPGFHKERTAIGDPYDMYAMTAAHKTLPLPCYARVTNLSNGRSVVVRINDRGPFKDERIIDLSYAAASQLDMIRTGTARVEVQVISGDNGAPTAPLYIQAGAFSDADNAERLAARLRSAGYEHTRVRMQRVGSGKVHRVQIGPLADVAAFDRTMAHLRTLGVDNAQLALTGD
jgi:rare lipoprotein A